MAAAPPPPRAYLTRSETFSAAHRLHSASMTDDENRSLYSKCNNANGHGHNYKLEVTLFGPIDARTGMVVDMALLKGWMQEVLDQIDHRNIDLDISYFRDAKLVSTTENVAVWVWRQLLERVPSGLLHEVCLHETDKNVFRYRGD